MRLEITKKTESVLRAICLLGDHEGRHTAADIAGAIPASQQIVPKLMEPLVKSGWVSSIPGPSGGYRLEADLQGISLLELIESVEGPTEDGRCVLRGTPCPAIEACALHDAWLPAREALLQRLSAVSIEEIRLGPSMVGFGNGADKPASRAG